MNFLVVILVCGCFQIASTAKIPALVAFEGRCPKVTFVENINITKFLGRWYGIRETGIKAECISYFIKEDGPNYYNASNGHAVKFRNIDDLSEGMTILSKHNQFLDDGDLSIFATDYGEWCSSHDREYLKVVSFKFLMQTTTLASLCANTSGDSTFTSRTCFFGREHKTWVKMLLTFCRKRYQSTKKLTLHTCVNLNKATIAGIPRILFKKFYKRFDDLRSCRHNHL